MSVIILPIRVDRIPQFYNQLQKSIPPGFAPAGDVLFAQPQKVSKNGFKVVLRTASLYFVP